MPLRLSRFVHLLPVGEDRVLVINAVSQLRLVVDKELGDLLALFAEMIDQDEPVNANLAAGDGRALAWLYRHGRILDRSDDAEGRVRLSVKLDHQALGQFERLFPEALGGIAAK